MNLTVNGVEYTPVRKTDEMPVKVVVLQRGWVCVGYYERNKAECKLTKAKTIRVWGTTKGLGELKDGPTSSTKLDDAGLVEFHRISEILTIDCDVSKWQNHLK